MMVIKKDKYFDIVSVKNALQKPKKVWKTSHYYSPLGEEIWDTFVRGSYILLLISGLCHRF